MLFNSIEFAFIMYDACMVINTDIDSACVYRVLYFKFSFFFVIEFTKWIFSLPAIFGTACAIRRNRNVSL